MTKVFSLLLTLTLVLGGVLGGAFAGGVALGKSQAPDSEGSAPAGARDGQRPSGQFNRERPGQSGSFGDRSRSGADSSGRQGLRGGDQGGPPDGRERRGFGGQGGRPGVSGTVAGIEGGQLTVTTPEGPVVVHLTPETTFQKVNQATLEEVQEGVRVRVVGRPGDDGVIQARSIMLVPEGVEAFPGRRDSQRSR